jgi:hypothetical protein
VTAALRSIVSGLDYQARWFWLEAIRLLLSPPALREVVLEARAPRAFDDVLSHLSRPDTNSFGDRVDVDGYQAKFKVDHRKALSALALSNPALINATTWSILERLRDAHLALERQGLGGRFTLVTPWEVATEDVLARLLTTNGELDVDHLFDGGSRSETGRLRTAWRTHLNLPDDDSLRPILRRFRIFRRSPDEVNRTLDGLLSSAQLAPAPPGSLRHPYVDTVMGLLRSRRGRRFDETTLRELVAIEGLVAPVAGPANVAIRSFRRDPTWNLQDITPVLLDLVPQFHGRFLKPGAGWDSIRGEVESFLDSNVETDRKYSLYLDTHSSIAYAAGWLASRGASIAPVQRTGPGLTAVWHPAHGGSGPDWAEPNEIQTAAGGPDLAVAISLAQDVRKDVADYVSQKLPQVRRVLELTIEGGPGPAAVVGGRHATELARAAAALLSTRPDDERGGRLHLFSAAPNGFLFHLGRGGRPFGPTTLYEYDFSTRALGAYEPAISLAADGR